MNRGIYYETGQNKEGKFCPQMKTNVLKTFLVMAMGITMAPAANAYDFQQDGLYYNILSEDGHTVEVTYLSDNSPASNNYIDGDVVIPSKIVHNSTTYTVTAIGTKAFSGCSSLKSVTIPTSVTEIGNMALYSCSSLTSVTIPSSVTSIGSSAFDHCSGLTSVTIPNSVTEIGSSAFSYCTGLTSVVIPSSVTSIGSYLFENCSGLTSVTIPNSVTEIGSSAFVDCSSLTSVTIPSSVISIGTAAFGSCYGLTGINVDAENPSFASEDGIVYSKDKTTLLICPAGKKGDVSVPNTVTTIDNWSFWDCSYLTSVTLPGSVTSIGTAAFSYCSDLTNITIPNSVAEIGNSAFEGCSSLMSVTIPNSVTKISSSTFEGCSSLASVTIPNSVIEIGSAAFWGCLNLTSVTIPKSVTAIGTDAFYYCSELTEINVDAENQDFTSEDGIVYSKDKTSLLICPAGKKGEITIPNSVTSIHYNAFRVCNSLTSVIIPNSVTEIGDMAFYGCWGLKSVTIPSSVTKIGEDAFSNCNSLESIYCQWSEPIECSPSFAEDVMNSAVLYVPKGCKGAYEKVNPWKNFLNIEERDYTAGIDNVADSGVEVKVVDGGIVAEGCAEMEVYSMGGQLVYRGTGRAENLAPGVYVARVGGKTVKVMVAR